jgi:hypothetical protein
LSQRPTSGGARRNRTDDLMLAKHALSQLSYGPFPGGTPQGQIRVKSADARCRARSLYAKMVGLGRLELPTSRLSSARSNQLSYKPQAQASPCAQPARAVKNTLRRKAHATRDIRPNTGKTARARPGRKRNEGGEVPHFRPYRPVVPSDPIGGKPRLAGPGYRICQIMPAGLRDHP